MPHPGKIDPAGGQQFAGWRLYIHGGESQRPADLVPPYHFPGNQVGLPQQLLHRFQVTCLHIAPHQGGTDLLPIQADLVYGLHCKSQFWCQLSQQGCIPPAAGPEGQVMACCQEPDIHLPCQHIPGKYFRQHGGRLPVQGEFNKDIHPHPSEEQPLLRPCGKFLAIRISKEHCRGRVKGKDTGGKPLPLPVQDLFQKPSMADVYPVKLADGGSRLRIQMKFHRVFNDFHA